MKTHLRGATKLAAFLLGFVLLIAFANRHLIITDTFASLTMHELKSRDDIELAIIGSSIVRDHFNVDLIEEATGLETFDVTIPTASMPASIALLKELYRTNSPEWVVLVTEPYTFETVREATEAQYKLMPSLSSLSNRVEYFLRAVREDGQYLNRLLMFREFGAASFAEITKTVGMRYWPEKAYQRLLPTIDKTVAYMGSGFVRHETDERADALIREGMPRTYTGYQYSLYEGSKAQLLEFKALCEANESKLIIAISPNLTAHALAEPGFLEYNESLMEFCSEQGIPCYNFSFAMPDLMPCLDEYYFDLYHMVGEGADIFSRAFARVLNAHAAGEDVSHLFHENRWQYVDAIDFITNTWVTVYRRGDKWDEASSHKKKNIVPLAEEHDVFLADCNKGTYVVPEYKFVLINEDGSETLLADFSETALYACAPGALDGRTMRIYCRAKGEENAKEHWYDYQVPAGA